MRNSDNDSDFWQPRPYLLEPIPEIFKAAQILNSAVDAHLKQDKVLAASLIHTADLPEVAKWTDTLWGKQNLEIHRVRKVENLPPLVQRENRTPSRMPTSAERKKLIQRDGFHCRYCGIPVIREEVRRKIHKAYPSAARWGKTTASQHAAFQCMWLVYEHVVPHARGGDNSYDNMIISCQPCNCAKMGYTLEEIGLSDPRLRSPVISSWDGLERFV